MSSLLDAIRHVGLLSPVQTKEAEQLASSLPTPAALAEALTSRKWLTAFQAKELLEGRGSELVIGSYVLLDRLGAGGMGEVFRAQHRLMGREVALKRILAKRLGKASAIKRFQREVSAASLLSHPNVVQVHDAGEVGGVHFLAMELLNGVNLEDYLEQRESLPPGEAIEYVRQACEGMQHAHEKGLVHRDLKPANLMLCGKRQIKILDLGLALVVDASTMTLAGGYFGTVDYMAPEQVKDSHKVDIRADVYSLGCTLYHLLAGQTPFADAHPAARPALHLTQEPPPIESFREDLGRRLPQVVRKMMAKRPEDRFQTPAEAAAELGSFLRQGKSNQSGTSSAVAPAVTGPHSPSQSPPVTVTPQPAIPPVKPSPARVALAAASVGVWGLDLGQCALKAIRLQEIDGKLTATAFDYVEYPKILSQPDADADQLTREALTLFLSRNDLRGDQVAIAVPGQRSVARFFKLPPVEEKKIADVVKFEAKQQIPFNLDEVVWDFQKLGSGNVIDGFALETEIGLFAIKRDVAVRYLGRFEEVVEVNLVQTAPLSLYSFVAYDLFATDANSELPNERGPCVAVLDVGADSSNLLATDGAKVIWQRPIPIGGNHFTHALTRETNLPFVKAEHLKRNASKLATADFDRLVGGVKPVFEELASQVQQSLGYFASAYRGAKVGYLLGVGNAFRLPPLRDYLEEKLQLAVRRWDRMRRLQGDAVTSDALYQENVLSFAVAYGLALQGLKKSRLTINLLPAEIRTERLVRAKKPWATPGG